MCSKCPEALTRVLWSIHGGIDQDELVAILRLVMEAYRPINLSELYIAVRARTAVTGSEPMMVLETLRIVSAQAPEQTLVEFIDLHSPRVDS